MPKIFEENQFLTPRTAGELNYDDLLGEYKRLVEENKRLMVAQTQKDENNTVAPQISISVASDNVSITFSLVVPFV